MATPTTRQRFERLHRRRPKITTTQMRDELGLTRQRIAQLEQETGIRLVRKLAPKREVGLCTICDKPLDYPGTTTHARCHVVTLTCAGCGVEFKRQRRDVVEGEPAWHTRACFSKNRRKDSHAD